MNYGKILRLTFDGKVYNISSQEKARLRIVNAYGEYIYPINVTQGAKDNEVYLHFNNLNNLVFPARLECLQTIAMGSEYISFGAFTVDLFLEQLWPVPGAAEYMEVSGADATGRIFVAFDGKAFLDEYAQVTNATVTGTYVTLTFSKRYFSEYAQVTGATASGQYCDINGNPL